MKCLLTLALLILTGTAQANGYGAVRLAAPAPGCATCPPAAPLAAPAPPRTVSRSEILRQETITTTRDVVELAQEPLASIQYAPAAFAPLAFTPTVRVRTFSAPSLAFSAGYGTCGSVASFATVRVPRVAVATGFGGTAVNVGRVNVQAGAGQFVDVRRGGLRGVLFGTRVRIR